MAKKLLLVDDEKMFLRSLKEGLEPLADIVEVDISYSVNEAIKYILINSYDLIITDIRMPEKSGIELLIYLKQARFPGKVMVMSAYSNEENVHKIRSYGVVEVISKPFKLEWFKKMLIDWFGKDKEQAVTFESIDLLTVLQIINLEKKTACLQIDHNGQKGMIYFVDGEIIHASFLGFEGERAVLKLIASNSGTISVKRVKENVKRTMELPFIEHMLNILKSIDELRRDQSLEAEKAASDLQLVTEDDIKRKEELYKVLNSLAEVKGYLAAGIFDAFGEFIEGSSINPEIDIHRIGASILDVMKASKQISQEVDVGNLEMLQLYTEKSIIFAKCGYDSPVLFNLILVIGPDGNIAMSKIKLSKAVDELKNVLY